MGGVVIGPRTRRLLAVASIPPLLAVAGLGLLATVTAVPHRAPQAAPSDHLLDAARHTPVVTGPDVLEADDDAYRVTFHAGGFTMAPSTGRGRLDVALEVVRRGDDHLALERRPWQAEGPAASRSVTTDATERIAMRSGEIEWDVVLDARPTGTGPLQVEASLEGAIDARPDRDGVRIRLEGGGVVHMGEVVVVDAEGSVLHRSAPLVAGRRLRLEVPSSALERAAYPLVVDPVISPEHTIPSGQGAQGQLEAVDTAIAFDGTNFLVVWETDGNGTDIACNAEIRAARVSPAGDVLATFLLSHAESCERDPAVALNGDGTGFLVVWEYLGFVVGTLVSTTGGDVADRQRLGIAGHGPSGPVQGYPTVVWNGSSFLVAYGQGQLGSIDLRASRVAPNGAILQSGIVVSSATGNQFFPAAASDGDNALVTWSDTRSGTFDVYGARVSPVGTVLDGAGLPVSTGTGTQNLPAVASDGTRWLVAWQDSRSGAEDVRAARVTEDGTVLDPSGIPVSTAAGVQDAVDVTGRPLSPFLVVWRDRRDDPDGDVYAARVTGDGDVLDATGLLVAASPSHDGRPSAAGSVGDDFGVSYDRIDVYLRTVSPK